MYLTELAAKKRILVRNKTDLPIKLDLPTELITHHSPLTTDVSCLSGQGMEALKDAIKKPSLGGEN